MIDEKMIFSKSPLSVSLFETGIIGVSIAVLLVQVAAIGVLSPDLWFICGFAAVVIACVMFGLKSRQYFSRLAA